MLYPGNVLQQETGYHRDAGQFPGSAFAQCICVSRVWAALSGYLLV